MPPYVELFPIGTRVRVKSRAELEAFAREWTLHHKLQPEQLDSADREFLVREVSFYHGGDALYELVGAPGIWHEVCLAQA